MSSSRQVRLIGEDAQKKLSVAKAKVRASSWIEERYLRGAGISELVTETRTDERFADLDPAAREVALGSLCALETIREILSS
jgi:hypothetical protein